MSACRTLQARLEPDGSLLFAWNPLAACRRYEPRKHPRTLAMTHPGILPSPQSDRVGYFNRVRFRGYLVVHWCSGLHPPCLRFAMAVTGHHARLGTRLRARLCRRRHLRQLNCMHFKAQRSSNRTGAFRASGSRRKAHGVAHGKLLVRALRRARPSLSCREASGYFLVADPCRLCLARSQWRSLLRA